MCVCSVVINECVYDSMREEGVMAGVQRRIGPNRVGVIRSNAMHSVDGLKLVVKETMKSK
jgi:NADH:ubiquinone oxidoreductase subunit H